MRMCVLQGSGRMLHGWHARSPSFGSGLHRRSVLDCLRVIVDLIMRCICVILIEKLS